MDSVTYIGEQLLPGVIGHLSVIGSFVAALLASIAYFIATNRRHTSDHKGWLNIGRAAFSIHTIAVLTVIGALFFIMVNQRYEYRYAWMHVSKELPFKYIFSAFWNDQEGSLLLWMFWNVVLGMILLVKSGKWEGPVLSVLALVQLFINSMLLGIYFELPGESLRFGSSPFDLLRNTMDAPIFNNAEYLKLIEGKGLNPLLQNYWMTIHPPTLFLGFASTAIPFCFAIAGLWTKDHEAWLKPAVKWALFSGMIFGTGILMGGAWAYEALSFGGYWAWDPVENMSLVPWLTLIAGLHTNFIARATGRSIRSTYLFYVITFVLVVYSTYLTRSGVLNDSSVHSFTPAAGLGGQLIAFIAGIFLLGFGLIISRYKGIPSPAKEESLTSREFWMFIGSLTLLFSAIIITLSTSLPVFNQTVQAFYPEFKGRVITEPISHYNRYQLWIAVLVCFLTGIAQYLRFKETNWKKSSARFLKHLAIASGSALILTFVSLQFISVGTWQYFLLLTAGWFAVVSNFDYFISFAKANTKLVASTTSHIGFGLMVVGIVASGVNKKPIFDNSFLMSGLLREADQNDENMQNNIVLFKGEPLNVSGYEVTFVHDTMDVFTRTFTINYKKKNNEGFVTEEFNLQPNILYDRDYTKIAASNPSTKRYFNRDIFTHVTALPENEQDLTLKQSREDSLHYQAYQFPLGQVTQFNDTIPIEQSDTFSLTTYRVMVHQINRQPKHPDYKPETGDLAVGLKMSLQRVGDDSIYQVEPMITLRGQLVYNFPAQLNALSLQIKLDEQIFAQVFAAEESLDYQTFEIKQGDKIQFKDLEIEMTGFNRQPGNPFYQKQEDDIAVGAQLKIKTSTQEVFAAEPVYFIRGNQQFNIKDEVFALGLHARFVTLDPKKETLQLLLAQKQQPEFSLPVHVATDAYRSDWLALQAIEFPGINFFWVGSCLMMLGLGLGLWKRFREKMV